MPNHSQFDGTPPGDQEPEGWAFNLGFLTAGSNPVLLRGKRPSYHPVIHFVGYAGIARTALASVASLGTTYTALVYAGCIVLALITGTLVKKSKSERFPRICSAALGMTGFAMANLAGDLGIHNTTKHGGPGAFLVPLSAVGFVVLVNVTGDLLTRWCPRKRFIGSLEAGALSEADGLPESVGSPVVETPVTPALSESQQLIVKA